MEIKERNDIAVIKFLEINEENLTHYFFNDCDRVIYITDPESKTLQGIITFGDFKRALSFETGIDKENIVNKKFSSFSLENEKEAITLLNSHDKIHAVPILNNGVVVKEYYEAADEENQNLNEEDAKSILLLVEELSKQYKKLVVLSEKHWEMLQESICNVIGVDIKYITDIQVDDLKKFDDDTCIIDIGGKGINAREYYYKRLLLNYMVWSKQIYDKEENETIDMEVKADYYDASYVEGGHDGNYHKHYKESIYYDSWKSAIKYLLLLNRDVKILEIGCGVGQFANMLFDEGFTNYLGFDFSEEAVKYAKYNNFKDKDKFFVEDAFVTPKVQENYDLIICFEVLEHIKRDLDLLNRINPGTKLLLSVPNFDAPTHFRVFSTVEQVYKRYSAVMNIFDINKVRLRPDLESCIYYIIGEKK